MDNKNYFELFQGINLNASVPESTPAPGVDSENAPEAAPAPADNSAQGSQQPDTQDGGSLFEKIVSPEPVQSAEPSDTDSHNQETYYETPFENSTGSVLQPKANNLQTEKSDESFEVSESGLATLTQNIASISDQILSIQKEISRLASYDVAVEQLRIQNNANRASEKRLFQEVEELKKGETLMIMKPLMQVIIEIHCEIKQTLEQYREDRDNNSEEKEKKILDDFCNYLEYLKDLVEANLNRFGITIVTFEVDTEFISGKQTIRKAIATDDNSKVGILAKVLDDCYMYDDKVIHPAKVYVYKHS